MSSYGLLPGDKLSHVVVVSIPSIHPNLIYAAGRIARKKLDLGKIQTAGVQISPTHGGMGSSLSREKPEDPDGSLLDRQWLAKDQG